MQEWKCPKCEHTNDDLQCQCGYKLHFIVSMFTSMSLWQGLVIGFGVGSLVGCLLYVLVAYVKAI